MKFPALILFPVFLLALSQAAFADNPRSLKRPNIVWIVSEDNSIHYLRHFFAGGAATPRIEEMASRGLTFDNAFSNAPVCSVARTTLATMCYGPRIGTQFHRRYKLAAMPEGLRMFPAYLREAGYYTTNNAKKDYNAIEGPGVWDVSSRQASWRNRPDPSQPFFHMESHGQSHEGSLHFNRQTLENVKTGTDPGSVGLADYFPDTPTFRYTHARYHDNMRVIDGIVGATLDKLKKDGLLEDTFVFYFGDHGGVLPRGKGYAYESGLHVPLVVRIPENFRDLSFAGPGQRIAGSVEFVDFGATALQLAGVKLPEGIDGRPFLGQGVSAAMVNQRNESFGYADRFDEKYDLVRSLRVGNFHYLRCYQPYLPDGLQNIYRYKMLAYQEWENLFHAGKLRNPQDQFYLPKSAEMLFDVEADPHEVKNLAADPAHRETLLRLRSRLQARLLEMPDLSFYPESYLVRHALENAVVFGREHREPIRRLMAIADLQLEPFESARPRIEAALRSGDPLKRYWGLMVCTAFGKRAADLVDLARPLLQDPEGIVRVRAAEFLGRMGKINPQQTLVPIVNSTEDAVLAVEALNSIVWFKDFFGQKYPVQRSDFDPRVRGGDVDDRLNYINGIPYPKKKNNSRGGKRKKNRAVPKQPR
ncbi:MAG: sulfatase-like hydrolase/transferase [Planctomycetota bacterium]|nr:sulfatase-like hydrolase/transferase [Planctomycetota bacterium]